MSYYGDSMSYYYGGAFANHSSLMTGVGRVHTPLRFAPHLSTISESPLSTYRRYSPMILPVRPKRIIDTADIDVSSPRNLHAHTSNPVNRLRRDRPTIRIRSQALKDNPALREHNARHEKTVGELLMEKFLIKDKKSKSVPEKSQIHHQLSIDSNFSNSQEALQRKVTRRMTRRRSSADVQMDPDKLEHELAIAQVQAEVLDTLVAEEQAEIEVETRRDEEAADDKKKLPKKLKKRKKSSDKPSPTVDKKDGKLFKIEASNSVGDLSTILVNARDNNEELNDSMKIKMSKGHHKHQKTSVEEEIVVVPIKKAYVHDNTRNSVYLTLKKQITKVDSDDDKSSTNEVSIRFDNSGREEEAAVDSANFRFNDKSTGRIESEAIGHFEGIKDVESIDFWALEDDAEASEGNRDKSVCDHVTVIEENSSGIIEGLHCDFGNSTGDKARVDDNFGDSKVKGDDCAGGVEDIQVIGGEGLGEIEGNGGSEGELRESLEESLLNHSGISLISTVDTRRDIESDKIGGEIGKSVIAEKSLGKFEDKENFEIIEGNDTSEGKIEGFKSVNSSEAETVEKKLDLLKSSTDGGISFKEIKSCKIEAGIKKPVIADKLRKKVEDKSENFKKIGGKKASEGIIGKIEAVAEIKPLKIENSTESDAVAYKSTDISKSSSTDSGISLREIKTADKIVGEEIKKPQIQEKSSKNDESLSISSQCQFVTKNLSKKSADFPEVIKNSSEILINKKINSSTEQVEINKSPEKSKLLSTNSGIGSLEIDPKIEEKPKKKLKNSKDFSFDISNVSPILSEKEKSLSIKRPKKKIKSSKTVPLELPKVPQKEIILFSPVEEENSLLKIGKIPIKKSESPQLSPVKEDAKLEPEIDFWSDIASAETPKKDSPKLSLKSKINENKSTKDSPKKTNSKAKTLKLKKSVKKPPKKIEKVVLENSSPETSDKMKILLTSATGEKSANDVDDNEDSEAITPVLEIPLPLINVEAPMNLQENEDDEGPKTPTNEQSSGNLTKWNKTTDLTILDVNVPSSDAGNEVTAAAAAKVSMKKQSRRKKSGSGYSVDTVIRKLPTEKSIGAISSDNDLLSSPYQTLPMTSPRNSPKVITKRPNDLVKMFYTTPSSLLTATPRDLSKVKRNKVKKKKHSTRTPSASSDSTGSTSSSKSTLSSNNSTEVEDETEQKRISSTRSNDSGFDGSPRLSNCDMACHKKCEKLTGNLCGLNQKLVAEALQELKRAPSQSSDNQRNSDSSDHVHGSGRITPPATNLPRFKKYTVEDFHFLKVLGKGSFGKVLLAELRGTDCVYAVKCLKKDVVLEDDDVECTLIERKVLTLATRHPYLCHLFCTFQTDSHLFFVMEYLNGGDLMFHIQKSGRFPEFRARFYAAEIWSGLNFLHKKGIVYRDLKLDNVLLDFEGHIRIADFGMCKLQIFLDRTADTFCGTPDYMAPEIIKGLKYNQAVDWWSFGVLLYEMLTGQSPFSGCDEDELFWSICNERPFIPRYLSQESMDMLISLLEKDSGKRPMGHEIQAHAFFHSLSWDRLERRLLDPPFKPALDHTLDTRYFDTAFTAERPRLTPVPEQILTSMDQGVFRGFSYTNPNATD